MNFQLWRVIAHEFVLIGCTLSQDRYISIAGIWGIKTKNIVAGEKAVFEDETAEGGTDYYYCTGKGKNWPKFIAFCPELEPFEFWDENKARIGTLEQEQYLFTHNLKEAHFAECMEALRKANLANINIKDTKGTIFTPHFKSDIYTYGTLILSLPITDEIQLQFKQLAIKEQA